MKMPLLFPARLLPPTPPDSASLAYATLRASLLRSRRERHASITGAVHHRHVVAGADEVVLCDSILSFPCSWALIPAMLSNSW